MRCEMRRARCEVRVFLSQSSLRWGEMIAFLRALRNIGDVLGSAQFFIYFCEFWLFLYAKIFFILVMFLMEQSWRNSFASKRWGKWCDDVVMCHVLKKVYTFYINTKIRLQFKYNPKIDLQSPFFCNNFSIYNLPF